MTQRAKRRQRYRKSQQAAKLGSMHTGLQLQSDKFMADVTAEQIQSALVSAVQQLREEFARISLPPGLQSALQQLELPSNLIDTGELRASMRVERRFQDEYDFNWREVPYQSPPPSIGAPPSAFRRAAESAMERQEALLRASAATMQIFQVSLTEATELVRRFCSEHCVDPDNLYQRLTDGRILMHPDRYLVLEPIEQHWVLGPTHGFMRDAHIDLAGFAVLIDLRRIDFATSDFGGVRTTATIANPEASGLRLESYRSYYRLWYRNTPILGQVTEIRHEQMMDRSTREIELEIPVVDEARRPNADGSFYRILRASQQEYDRRLSRPPLPRDTSLSWFDPKPTRPKACENCRNYHGQTHGGNLLICAMHPYGVEDERCEDWEDKKLQLADLNQLAEENPRAFQAAAAALGVAVSELKGAILSGEVSSSEFMSKLAEQATSGAD